jgi:arsenate reductase
LAVTAEFNTIRTMNKPDPGGPSTAPKTVLVICTGNSCRSQMAEVILNHDLAGQVRALSAGSHPHHEVSSGAIEALKLAGLPTAGLHPKGIDAVMGEPIDLLVTVCNNARESCPVFPGAIQTIHLPFHDPFGEPLEGFVKVRDDLRARLVPAVRAALGLAC